MNFELYENINYSNLKTLIDLSKVSPGKLSLIKNNYLRNNQYFQESFNFLVNIELFIIKNNSIVLNYESNKNLEQAILDKIKKQSDYSASIKNYLLNFYKDENGDLSFRPSGSYNIASSDLRNFLITLNFIKYDNERYILLDENVLTQFKKKEFSPDQLKNKITNQELLGLKGEKVIVDYETKRIKLFGEHLMVDHVSLRDVSAGYDIQSYEGNEKIFIEVKAVSLSNYKFHLSTNEYQTAINLKDKYYLYLLPVDYSKPEKFDIDRIVKINNIKDNIFLNKNSWNIDNDGYVISKK